MNAITGISHIEKKTESAQVAKKPGIPQVEIKPIEKNKPGIVLWLKRCQELLSHHIMQLFTILSVFIASESFLMLQDLPFIW